jgi:hypothetical protein
MPARRNAGRIEMRCFALAGNRVADARGGKHRRLQFALGVSCLLHALVYAHYRCALVEDIDADAAVSRRAASHVSLFLNGGASSSNSPHLPDLADTSFSPSTSTAVARQRVPEAGDESAGASAEGDGKFLPDEPYYTRDMLNRSAQPISDIRLPPELLPLIPRQLLLELWIDRHGTVRKVVPIKPVQVSPAILRGFNAFRFIPASRNGLPVNSRKLIELVIDGP